MKRVVFFLFVLIIYPGNVLVLAQESKGTSDEEKIKEEVWEVVRKRNTTWLENDFSGHMDIYHKDFRRWSLHSKTLMTKEIFASFWEGIKKNEAVIKIDIERKEMQLLDEGRLAIAHYTVDEVYQWIGENKSNDKGKTIKKGQVLNGKLRFSDIYLKVNDNWKYVGGHRDGAFLN